MTRPGLAAIRSWIAFGVLPVLLALAFLELYRTPRHGETGDPLACLVMTAFALAAVWLGRPGAADLLHAATAPIRRHGARAVTALAAVAGVVYLLVARGVLDAFPNSGDEVAYVLQAQTFALGRLWVEAPPAADVLRQSRFHDIEGMWISLYPPGWAALLAPLAALKVPLWIANPVLGAATLLVFYALARRDVPREAAWLGAAILGFSAFFVVNSASFFNHTLAALAGLLLAWFGLRFIDRGRAVDAVLAGVCIGVLGLTRTQNAIPFGLAFAAALLLIPGRRPGLLWCAIGGAPLLAALLAYNGAITGDPLTPVQTWYDNETFDAPNSETLQHAASRLARLLTWTSPLLLLGYGAAFGLLLKQRALTFVDWIVPLTGTLFLVYGGQGGNQYGPRYYFEAWPLALLTLLKVAAPLLNSPRWRDWTASAVLVVLTMQAAYLVPRLDREHRVIVERERPFRVIAAAGLRNAIVLIDRHIGTIRPLGPEDLVRNGLDPARRSVILALDYPDRRAALVRAYPGRRLYVLKPEPGWPEPTVELHRARTAYLETPAPRK